MRVVLFENRMSGEMRSAVERFGGKVLSAPAMRELPVPHSPGALAFAEALLAGRIDMVIFLTGVGARALLAIIEEAHPREAFLQALSKVVTVARGPKPVAAMREWRITPTHVATEPNTWRSTRPAQSPANVSPCRSTESLTKNWSKPCATVGRR